MSDTSKQFEAASTLFDGLMQIAEMATGYRRRLEAQGWSPTVAEQIAAAWLVSAQGKAMTQ